MDEQIVKSLIGFYKERGIDLYAVLDDPLFDKLPLATKVKLLKQFASHIASGTSRGLNRSDINAILKDAALTGVGTALLSAAGIATALGYFQKGKIPFKALGAGVAIGSGLAAYNALSDSKTRVSQRAEVVDELQGLAKNPTDDKALKLLALRGWQLRPNTNVLATSKTADKLKAQARALPGTLIGSIPDHVAHRTFINNYGTSTRSNNVTEQELDKAFDNSSDSISLNPFKK